MGKTVKQIMDDELKRIEELCAERDTQRNHEYLTGYDDGIAYSHKVINAVANRRRRVRLR